MEIYTTLEEAQRAATETDFNGLIYVMECRWYGRAVGFIAIPQPQQVSVRPPELFIADRIELTS